MDNGANGFTIIDLDDETEPIEHIELNSFEDNVAVGNEGYGYAVDEVLSNTFENNRCVENTSGGGNLDDVGCSLPTAGDANLDRAVDFADFVILAENFGKQGGWIEGDFNEDGEINFDDFGLLAENFGATPGEPS